MNTLTSIPYRAALETAREVVYRKSSELAERYITVIKSASVYLEDPRYASASVFFINFFFIETATRLGVLAGRAFPSGTPAQRDIKFICIVTLMTGIVALGNVAYIKAAHITLDPVVICALVIVSFVTKIELENRVRRN